jgi:hypothetical protein
MWRVPPCIVGKICGYFVGLCAVAHLAYAFACTFCKLRIGLSGIGPSSFRFNSGWGGAILTHARLHDQVLMLSAWITRGCTMLAMGVFASCALRGFSAIAEMRGIFGLQGPTCTTESGVLHVSSLAILDHGCRV